MTTYTVREGDTLERISSLSYGVPEHANLIKAANASASGGLPPGAELFIPDLQDLPEFGAQITGGEANELGIFIDGKRFRFWHQASVTEQLDSLGSFNFVAPFDPDNQEFRETFVPLSYKPAQITLGGERILTGTLVNPVSSYVEPRVVTCTGYSKPGVLNDCTMPGAETSREYDNASLSDIARDLLAPFGITPLFLADPIRKRV